MFSAIKNIKSTVPYITFRRYNKALRRLVKLPGYLGTSHGCPVTSAWAITSASTAGVILSTA